jgi:hypothetical protein
MQGEVIFDLPRDSQIVNKNLTNRPKEMILSKIRNAVEMSHNNLSLLETALRVVEDKVPVTRINVSSHLPPCDVCGSTDFIRTGSCHTCNQCAKTTGCS